jgi:2-oxoglutarate dehydrogenase complex dehydrogenase (E1) component-like enzyme
MYWDLVKARDERGIGDVAIVRVEQLYPFPAEELGVILERFSAAERVWVQEEPANMGAWWFMRLQCEDRLGVTLTSVTRAEGAAPATGSMSLHQKEQADLIDRALGGE